MPPLHHTPPGSPDSASASRSEVVDNTDEGCSHLGSKRILMEEETEQHDQSIVMELYFGSVEKAVESWKKVQQLPNYELVVGTILFKE